MKVKSVNWDAENDELVACGRSYVSFDCQASGINEARDPRFIATILTSQGSLVQVSASVRIRQPGIQGPD